MVTLTSRHHAVARVTDPVSLTKGFSTFYDGASSFNFRSASWQTQVEFLPYVSI
jgi:hypothetical protein